MGGAQGEGTRGSASGVPKSMMHMRGASVLKSILEADAECLARSEYLRLSLSRSRGFFRVPTF